MNYSLEDGLKLSSLIVSVFIHGCRDPGIEKTVFLLIEKVFPCCLFNGELKARGYVMAEKKKLKNLRTYREGHRSFVRKTIDSVAELLSGENPVDVKKLRLFRAGLQTKYSEFQA